MTLIDFILNVAGLLLWLNWRAIRFDPFTRTVPATLAGTIRRAEAHRRQRWHFLAALFGLLLVRAIIYWQVGPALNWVPTLDLVVVAAAFRCDFFAAVLLYSTLSFLRALVVFYFWLIFLAVLNRNTDESEPFHKVVQLQLGRTARWPWFVQLILPLFIATALWVVLHPLLVWTGVMNRVGSLVRLVEQGLLTGAAVYLSLKYLLPALLFTHLIASYVYLGNSPLWEFVSTTARNALAPLNRLPLRLGKMDFAPLAGIVIVLLMFHFLPMALLRPESLPKWARLVERGWLIWPQ